MISPRMLLGIASLVTAVGIWWLLPGRPHAQRVLGALLAAIGFGMFASQVPLVGEWLAKGLLAAISIVTVVAGVATISCRSPVYCAIWFGMTLVGTAGLFLLAGAAFLAVATIVVYAGAILVTFLFVLMLSQPEGHTTYDRRSWEAPISAFIGAVLVGILTATIAASVKDVGHGQQVAAGYDVLAAGRGAIHPLSVGRRGGGRAALRGPRRRGGDREPRPRGNEAARRAFPRGRYE